MSLSAGEIMARLAAGAPRAAAQLPRLAGVVGLAVSRLSAVEITRPVTVDHHTSVRDHSLAALVDTFLARIDAEAIAAAAVVKARASQGRRFRDSKLSGSAWEGYRDRLTEELDRVVIAYGRALKAVFMAWVDLVKASNAIRATMFKTGAPNTNGIQRDLDPFFDLMGRFGRATPNIIESVGVAGETFIQYPRNYELQQWLVGDATGRAKRGKPEHADSGRERTMPEVERVSQALNEWLVDVYPYTQTGREMGPMPATGFVPIRFETLTIAGFKVALNGFDEGRTGRSEHRVQLDLARGALATFRKRAERYLPELLTRMSLPIVVQFVTDGSFGGFYTKKAISIAPASYVAWESGRDMLVKTLAHEFGHHYYHTILTREAKAFWSATIGGKTPLDVRKVLAAMDKRGRYQRADVADAGVLEELAHTDPVTYLQLRIACTSYETYGKTPALADSVCTMPRAKLETLADKAPLVPVHPITVYGATNDDEAFAEAVGHMVANGPQTVLEPIREAVYRLIPKMRRNPEPGLRENPAPRGSAIDRLLAEAPTLPADATALLAFWTKLWKVDPLQATGASRWATYTLFPDESRRPDPTDRNVVSFSMPAKLERQLRTHTAAWAEILRAVPDHWGKGAEWKAERVAHTEREKAEDARTAAYEGQGAEVASGANLSKLRGKRVWLYHGTSDVFLPRIQVEGLRPGMESSNFGSKSQPNKRQKHVYLTTDYTRGPAGARTYAEQATRRHGGNAIVLRVLVAGDMLTPDKDDADLSTGQSQFRIPEVEPNEILEVDGEPVTWGRRSNPAVPRTRAARAHLDSRHHFAEAATREAQAVVAEVLAGRGTPLGTGNFGATYRVDTPNGPLLVKLGRRSTLHTRSPLDMYGDKWNQGGRTMRQMRSELTHEAGIANTLSPRHRVVPATVYAEHKGKPALVREYGTLGPISFKEYDRLSLDLAAVLADGWSVQDQLLVARRPDGSLFIADVGVWGKIEGEGSGAYEPHRAAADDLSGLLDRFSRTQPWAGGQDVPSIVQMNALRARLDANEARLAKRPGDKILASNVNHVRRIIETGTEARRAAALRDTGGAP